MPGTILKTKLLSLGASAYLGAYAIAAPFSTAQAWCLAWHSDLSDKICFLQRDYNRRDKRDAACSNRPNQPSLIAIFWPFLANFLLCTKIFHKTEVQTGILRCWRGLNLNWFKSYDTKLLTIFRQPTSCSLQQVNEQRLLKRKTRILSWSRFFELIHIFSR